MNRIRPTLRRFNYWISPLVDPRKLCFGLPRYGRFFKHWLKYSRMQDAEHLSILAARPSVEDWTSKTEFDHHYTYLNGWAFRKICDSRPDNHVDVGSQIGFITLLSAVVPVVFIDIRPLTISLSGLEVRSGNVLALPFRDRELKSLSSLHVIEHIGLGRYGDELDPLGTRKAIKELARVLAPEGNLYVGIPVGRQRVCFNAYRVYSPEDICAWFQAEGMSVLSFCAVDDEGIFRTDVSPRDMREQDYACGMYHLTRTR